MSILKWIRSLTAGGDEMHDVVEHTGWKGEKGHAELVPTGGFIWKMDMPPNIPPASGEKISKNKDCNSYKKG